MSVIPGQIIRNEIIALQRVTVLWMCLEAAVAIVAAIQSRSVALLGFGGDSVIELASAVVVLLRFKDSVRLSEALASRIAGILLLLLGVFIFTTSVLALTRESFRSGVSYLGIGLLVATSMVMPWLSARKRALAAKTGSGSLRADAVQSSMCVYLAWIALAGLLLNALFKLSWADPAAALLLLPIVIREGWEAIQGKSCGGCAC